MNISPEANLQIAAQNRTYYDKIADCYETMLDNEADNTVIRNAVEKKFKSVVTHGRVLDFGGGTGLDLKWLAESGYQVIFCEPSEKMREKAMEKKPTNPLVTFLKNKETDFTKWETRAPFVEKMDAILSNFAVVNCIVDIEVLFKSLSLVINSGSNMIALVLQRNYKKNYYWRMREEIKYALSRQPLMINVLHGDCKQVVYLYSLRQIKKASEKWFDIRSHQHIHQFTLLHLVRK